MKIFRYILISIVFCLLGSTHILAQESSGDAQEKITKTEEKKIHPLQKTINTYILQIYKVQGDKILEDLDISLEKLAPTKEAKIEVYTNIQETLHQKKEAIDKDASSNKTVKTLLKKYLDYMIKELDSKKKKLGNS